MTLRVAINGFGRIGEMFLRQSLTEDSAYEVVAVNDILSLDQITYLLRYDSVHRPAPAAVSATPDGFSVAGRPVRVFQESDPVRLPWRDLNIDVVVECTGVFRDRAGLSKHLAAGARRVVLTAPAKAASDVDITVCVGVNDALLQSEHALISNASCTTNCLAPVVRAIREAFGWRWGLMTTVHAYTGSQAVLDAAQKRMRRGRAAALNIVPTSTGAAKAIDLVLPDIAGTLDGMAFRVPVPDGSVVDLVFESERPFTVASLHAAFASAAQDPSYRGVLAVTEDEVVSSDIIGTRYSALVDATSTLVQGDRRAKVVAWYDNEWGYAARVRDLVMLMV
jgi:glyceraldehyde 3-phosphate dehydrogenase